ncbi:response regulator transcription factor [Cohnella phaseoli]|uniref:YesN/AraC family two-component response regulator n=1 Tax=Cohnella phaseoli TaxID=456490 RepID=A0A3D9JNR5_9BACL|nr:response regulator [Cohnella phaseoli]RED75733.1 YesN/AraC family two-component response regulator [Cohnella phaseoli]
MTSRQSYTVIVAEDEQIILDNIIQKIDQADLNFKVIASAADGEDALLLVEQMKPDVLFTDIHMPAMDGLELIKRAKAIRPDLEIVIISGYNDFSYAQQAIRLGVTDYILKPVKKDLLRQTIVVIKARLDLQTRRLESDLIDKMVHGVKSPPALTESIKATQRHMYLICLGNQYTYSADVLDTDYFDRLWSMIDWSKITANCTNEAVSWHLIDDKFFNQKFLILNGSEQACHAEKLMNAISSSLLHSVPVTVCTEEEPVSLEQIRDTARRMRTYLERNLLCCLSSLITTKDRKVPDRPSHQDSNHMNSIKLFVKQQQFDSLQNELLHLFSQWEKSDMTQRQLEKLLTQLADELMTLIGHEDDDMMGSIEKELYDLVAISTDSKSLFNDALQILNSYMGPYSHSRKKGSDTSEELYNKLEEYIRMNMSEQITVSSLAEKFNFNPSYIIRVFKKCCGEPPMKYLTSLRINEAKRLIERQAELDFKDIAEIIGYSEQQYFSRVFKNMTGMSPSEYRESIKK